MENDLVDMDRRTLLSATGVVIAASTAGCLEFALQSDPPEESESIPLESVAVRNESDAETKFTLTVVENREDQHFHQKTVPSGESTRPSQSWDTSSESIVIVGMAKRYGNYEVVSMNESDGEIGDLAVEFRVDQQGDVHGNLLEASDL